MSLANVKHMISTERFACRIDAASGVYSLYDVLKNQFVIENGALAIQAPGPAASRNLLFAGDDLSLDQDASEGNQSYARLVYKHKKFPIGLTAEWKVEEDETGELRVRVAFDNLGQKAFGLRALLPLYIDPQRDGSIDLGGVWSHGAMLRNGFASGSDCTIEHFSKPDGTLYDSHAFALFHHLFSQRNLAIGFITLKDQFGRIVASPDTDGMHLSAICDCDDVRIEPGQSLCSETLWLRVTDGENEQVNRYLTLSSASCGGARAAKPAGPPTGCSFAPTVDEPLSADSIDEKLAWMTAHKADFPLQYAVIGDGWQTGVGDWQTIDRGRFKEGLAGVAAKIAEAGFVPGLWLAPFIARATSALYEQHPDWFLRDATGKPVNVLDRWGGACHALDLTNDAVTEWLERTIKTIAADWGFRYLRLDHLACAVVEGVVRADAHLTRAQAYRKGIETIRAAAGDNVYLAGIAAPLAASVGVLDSCRIDADVRPSWETTGVSDGIRLPARNAMVRSNLNSRWFQSDPDFIPARYNGPVEGTERDERETLTTFIGLVGGATMLSGDLGAASCAEIDALRFVFPPLTPPAIVPHPMLRAVAPNFNVIAQNNRCVVAVYNWGDMPEQATIDLGDLGLNRNLRHLVYDVKEQYLVSNHLVREWVGRLLPPHCVRLIHFALTPSSSKPMLVGSTFHIGQGAVELVGYEWAQQSMNLSLSLPYWVGRGGALTFYAPDIEGADLTGVEGASEVKVSLENQEGGRVLLVKVGKVLAPSVRIKISVTTS
ncbi:MAG: alpha-galactosidase [Capsulimonadaceae bacterium]|nr:alpha-galactosidase [Capsulimonadaceae bacterium]